MVFSQYVSYVISLVNPKKVRPDGLLGYDDLLIIDRGNVSIRDQSLFIAGGGGGGGGASRMIFWTPPFKWCFTEVVLITPDKFRDSPQSFRRPKKENDHQRQEERRKARGKPEKQCRKKRLKAHQL